MKPIQAATPARPARRRFPWAVPAATARP
jgi:hypothetical protein